MVLPWNPNWEFVGESTNGAGQNACLAGDVNGDGQEDIILSGICL